VPSHKVTDFADRYQPRRRINFSADTKFILYFPWYFLKPAFSKTETLGNTALDFFSGTWLDQGMKRIRHHHFYSFLPETGAV
jgi:hypothetical protein